MRVYVLCVRVSVCHTRVVVLGCGRYRVLVERSGTDEGLGDWARKR